MSFGKLPQDPLPRLLLRDLIGHAGIEGLSEELERVGAFTPMPAEECATCLMS